MFQEWECDTCGAHHVFPADGPPDKPCCFLAAIQRFLPCCATVVVMPFPIVIQAPPENIPGDEWKSGSGSGEDKGDS